MSPLAELPRVAAITNLVDECMANGVQHHEIVRLAGTVGRLTASRAKSEERKQVDSVVAAVKQHTEEATAALSAAIPGMKAIVPAMRSIGKWGNVDLLEVGQHSVVAATSKLYDAAT